MDDITLIPQLEIPLSGRQSLIEGQLSIGNAEECEKSTKNSSHEICQNQSKKVTEQIFTDEVAFDDEDFFPIRNMEEIHRFERNLKTNKIFKSKVVLLSNINIYNL